MKLHSQVAFVGAKFQLLNCLPSRTYGPGRPHVGFCRIFLVLASRADELFTGPDLAGGRPGAQPNYKSISVTGASLGAHKTRAVAPEAEVERSRHEDRGCPPPHGGEVWGGGCAPSPENFSIFELKTASFGASLVLFFAVD